MVKEKYPRLSVLKITAKRTSVRKYHCEFCKSEKNKTKRATHIVILHTEHHYLCNRHKEDYKKKYAQQIREHETR